jgi:endonuclease YncB( thermonuclease family)
MRTTSLDHRQVAMRFAFATTRRSLLCLAILCLVNLGSTRAQARPVLPMPSVVAGEQLTGRLAVLQDGDSFIAATPQGRITIRIAGIDAPERFQAFSGNARGQMQQLLQGRDLRIHVIKIDQYQRAVAQVFSRHEEQWIDVGLEQITQGLAWHYKRYAKEQELAERLAYTRAEEDARKQRRGLWKDLDTASPPQAPWDYRKERR